MRKARCGFNDGPAGSGRQLLVAFGPTLDVNIGFDPDYRITSAQRPQLPDMTVQALLDTGATESCIDAMLAAHLGLPVVDQRMIGGVGGSHKVNVHLAQIYIPDLNYTINGLFSAVSLRAGGQHHLALIGRTFLQDFRMVYDGSTGTVELTHIPPPSA